jgi:hypothetical protein
MTYVCCVHYSGSSQSSTLYLLAISSSVYAAAASSGMVKPRRAHDRMSCSAASSCAPILRRRGSRRSPSSLNKRSHSQLEAGMVNISIARRLRWGYLGARSVQYRITLPLLCCSFVHFGSYLRYYSYSSRWSLLLPLSWSTSALIASSISPEVGG